MIQDKYMTKDLLKEALIHSMNSLNQFRDMVNGWEEKKLHPFVIEQSYIIGLSSILIQSMKDFYRCDYEELKPKMKCFVQHLMENLDNDIKHQADKNSLDD